MCNANEILKERLIVHEKLKLTTVKPVFRVHRFCIFKLKIVDHQHEKNYGEINFLLHDPDSMQEKCIVYVQMLAPGIIHQVKYWRAGAMDKELAGYVIKAFIEGYLQIYFIFENRV